MRNKERTMRNENSRIKKRKAGLSLTCFSLLIIFLSLFIFPACQDPFNSLSPQTPERTGSVTLIIGGVNGRTILHGAGLSYFKSFTFDFYDAGEIGAGTPHSVTYDNDRSSYTIPLAEKTYDLLVSAWADTEKSKLAAQGIVYDVTVPNGTAYTVYLEALITEDEEGSFEWQIKFPAGLDYASMTIVPADETTGTTLPPVEFTCGTAAFTAAGSVDHLNSGYYNVTFELRRGAQRIIYREILHVYQNLKSSFNNFEFKEEYFSSTIHTVTFVFNDGKTPPLLQSCVDGALIKEDDHNPVKPVPAGLYQPGPPPDLQCKFDGWYSRGVLWTFSNPVAGDMTLAAHWSIPNIVDVSGKTGNNDVIKAINYFTTEPAEDYTLLIGASDLTTNTSVIIGNHTLPANGTLTIKSLGGGERILMGASGSPLFTINGDGAVLTLEKNITLFGSPSGTTPQAAPSGTTPLVSVIEGKLVMEEGSKITGHNTSSPNGAVYLNGTKAVFNMIGGEITGNKTTSASIDRSGGVYVNSGTFTMSGGRISGNTVSLIQADVFINDGSFTMSNDAQIGVITLKADDTAAAVIGIASGFTGGVNSLNFYTADTSITGVPPKWLNKQALKASGSYALTASDVEKFAPGSFINASGAVQAVNAPDDANGAPIGYIIADSGTNIGKLVVNSVTAAKINSTEYQTLYKAIEAAQSGSAGSPTVITLLRNITVPEPGMTSNTGYIIDNKHIKITVESGKDRVITASAGSYRLFTVNSGASLSLDGTGGSLTLKGNEYSASNRQGVFVNGGTFDMKNKVTINGFNNNGGYGGGVYVTGGTFTMEDCEIAANTAISGGGVYINGSAAKFTMQGGAIKKNKTTGNNSDSYYYQYNGGGGGVYVNEGTFTMQGGEISNNNSTDNNSDSYYYQYNGGGGVYVYSGTFEMQTGEIAGNSAICGGGVYLSGSAAKFTMHDGTVKNNNSTGTNSSSYNGGGGVYLYNYAVFEMKAGEIMNNTAVNRGGGIFSYYGTFNMSGGFIYGVDDDNAPSRKNTANDSGTRSAAIYVYSGTAKYTGDYGGGKFISSNNISTTSNTLPPFISVRIPSTGNEYYTLNMAINAAANTGTSAVPTEIIILRDITVPELEMSSGYGYSIPNNTYIKLTVESGQNRSITAAAGGFSLFSISGANRSLTLEGKDGGILTLNGNNETAASGRQGVYVYNGTFIMNNDAVITGFKNSSTSSYTGGVYLSGGTFTMNGGKITGNSSSSYGGGVYIGSGTFTMNDGEISSNTATNYGGGVYITGTNAKFYMNDGTIKGNSSASNGGGVYVASSGIFTKTGGTITGYSNDPVNGNVVKNSSGVVLNYRGHAVYIDLGKRRESTAGPTDPLDSQVSGAGGGWIGLDDIAADAVVLSANTWADGNIPLNGEQWFKFTATAATQYIHVSFGTLSDLYVQLYNSNGTTNGSQSNLYGSTRYASRTVTIGEEYYIRVWPYSSGNGGTYKIGITASATAPAN